MQRRIYKHHGKSYGNSRYLAGNMEGTLQKKTQEKKVFGIGSDKRKRYYILDYTGKQFV